MQISVVSDIKECEKLWKQFLPQRTIWDLWETVYSFYDSALYEPYFMVLSDQKQVKGVLPLWKDFEVNKYFFFGGMFPEDRHFWFDTKLFPLFFEHMPTPIIIYDINSKCGEEIIKKYPEYEKYFSETDYRYFLNIKQFNQDINKYLATFNKKHRKNFLNDMKKVDQYKCELIWEKKENFDTFVSFSVKRFGEESDFSDPQFVKEMHSFLSMLEEKKMIYTLTIKINGVVEGIEIAARYNNYYYVLNGSYNEEYKNLGKLLIFEHIKKAISMGADEVDFLVGDTGWKQLWNLEREICYTFRK